MRPLDWWIGELALLRGPGPRSGPQWRALLLRSDNGTTLHLRQGRTIEAIATLAPDATPDEARAVVSRLDLKRKGITPQTTILRLNPRDVVSKRIKLPFGVRDMLAPVVRNQLERLAPWPAEQALFACREAGLTDDGRQIEVDVWIAGRARVETFIAELTALGIPPGIVDVGARADETPGLDLLGTTTVDLTRRRATIARALSIAAAATMAASAAAFTYAYRLDGYRATIETAITGELRAAAAATAPRDAEARRRIESAITERRRSPSMSIAMEVLSRALPDDAYLERIEIRNGLMTLTGRAQNVPSLIGPLEETRHFEAVQFAAPTTRRDGESRDEFSISVRLRPSETIEPLR